MTPDDILRAAARCWERAGHPDRAAERWSAGSAWSDAGRCWAKARRPVDAAGAYARAGDPLAEARQWLTSPWPERARSAYQRVLQGDASAVADVEALLGLADLESALRRALDLPAGFERLDALHVLARLAASRGRTDVSSRIWTRVAEGDMEIHGEWELFAPWNRSLRWERPETKEAASVWPSIPFTDVALTSISEHETGHSSHCDRALDWSADGTQFVAALNTQGLGWGHVAGDRIRLKSWTQPRQASCARFVPETAAVLAGHHGGEVRVVQEDGSAEPVETLRMQGNVWSVVFSRQGDRVAVSSFNGASAIRLKTLGWNSGRPGEGGEDLRETGGYFPLCAWSPQGIRLVWSLGPERKANRLIFLASEGRQEIRDAHGALISSLSFTPEGRLLISASWDKTVVIRDGQNGQPLAPPERFDNEVYGASLHPQAALLAVGEGRRLHLLRLHVGDPPRLTRLSEQPMNEDVRSLAFSPDGRHLLMMTSKHLHLLRVHLYP